jgi:hypothetical protein
MEHTPKALITSNVLSITTSKDGNNERTYGNDQGRNNLI